MSQDDGRPDSGETIGIDGPDDEVEGARITVSPDLLVAPFLEGSAVFDPVSEQTHLLGPLASWIITADGPSTGEELVDDLVGAIDIDRPAAQALVVDALETLTGLGLLGRNERVDRPERPVPQVREPEPDWTVGAAHGVPGNYLAFCGPDPELIGAVDALLGAPAIDVDPTVYLGLVPVADAGVDVIDDAEWHFDSMQGLLWQLPGVINDHVARSAVMVVLHAGAVRTPGGKVVIVTGPVDTGKSTLVAALVRAGCDYLGDESIGIGAQTLDVWAYPKPLTLDPISQGLVGLDPIGEPMTSGEHRLADEIRRGAISSSGPVGSCDLVVHTAYRPHARPRGARLAPTDAVELLLTNTLNLLRSGQEGLETLCRLGESVPVISVTHGDTSALAASIVDLDADPDRLVEQTPEHRR